MQRRALISTLTGMWLAGLAACTTSPTAPLPQASDEWFRLGQAELATARARPAAGDHARNVILFIGDGLDLSTVTAARILEGQQNGGWGEENTLSFETFPFTGLAKTYNTDRQTPDSAGTVTAMLSGVKTKAGVIGAADGVRRKDCASLEGQAVTSLIDLAERQGLATGIVTTTRITHATPAAAYAHAPERKWENDSEIPEGQRACSDIALQLVNYDAGDGIDVLFGGGRRNFLPHTSSDPEEADAGGRRSDGQDLVSRWQSRAGPGGRYIWNLEGFQSLRQAPPRQVLGLFHSDHMQYEVDRAKDPAGEPSLAEMTSQAISMLSRNPRGYFLLVEGGRIDHAHHDGNAYRALTETLAFADAVASADALTSDDDTLIIVTSDHGHTMRISGYATRGNPILGLVVENDAYGQPNPAPARDLHGLPYTTLGYINGPGHQGPTDDQPEGPKRWRHTPSAGTPASGRSDLANADTQAPDYLQEAGIATISVDSSGEIDVSETHSAGDVPIYAKGPGARLLSGVHEQNFIFHVLRFVQKL